MKRRYPRPAVIRRERLYRGGLVLAIGLLLVLTLGLLMGHHLPVGRIAQPDSAHLWALCLVALHALLGPVHGLFHVLFVTGIAYAAWDRLHAWRRQRATLSSLATQAARPGDPFWEGALRAGIDPNTLRVMVTSPNPAFTVGWLRPRVFVARELADRLSRAELTAVLAHEAAHAARHDPLRLSLLRFLRCTLFWLPALRDLSEDVADESEIQADDRAAALDPLVLATAILKLALWPAPPATLQAGVGFQQPDLLDRRVRRLAGEDVRPGSRLTRRSAAIAATALLLALASGVVVAHPIPDQVDPASQHCDGHRLTSLFHLFCPGLETRSAALHCPTPHSH